MASVLTISPSQTKKRPLAACACILAAGSLWGMIGMWNRYLMAGGLSPTSIVLVRNLGGAILLSGVLALRDRSVFRVEKAHLKYFFGTGVISIVLFTACYFSCQQVCSLALASILLYTAPAIVMLLSALLWKEPVTRRKLLALALTLSGCALVCGVFGGDLTATPGGILLGLGAGFFYALYSIFGRYALAHYGPMTVTVWTFLFAGAGSLVLLRPEELACIFASSSMLALTAGLILISTVLPYLCYNWGLSRVEAGKASILASVEPVVASLLGVAAFGEPVSVTLAAGVLCVLASVWILR